MTIAQLRAAREAAVKRLHDAKAAIDSADESADLVALEQELTNAVHEVERTRGNLEERERVEKVLAANPIPEAPEADQPDARPEPEARITVGREEPTYRPDQRGISFLSDLLLRTEGNAAAIERLERNRIESLAHHGLHRDMGAAATEGGDFLPPLYLGSMFVEPNIAGRPFADALPKFPLPPTGTAITIPSFASGVTVAARSDKGTVEETDGVTAEITHDVNEISGQVDVGRIVVMRSDPSLDIVVVRTLRRRYDAYLDTQLLAGSGTAPEHRGIRNVSSVNTVAYTDATPTAAELLPKIYDAVQKIATNRLEVFGDTVVLHPRRAAWLASNLSSTVPLFQFGGLNQAVGTQGQGFARDLSGLDFILDPNIGTTYGNPGTNQDEIYVVAREDLLLAEGPLMVKVWDGVGSATGVIRYQVFAHSAFLSKRYPKSISIISGTGLATPSF